MLKKVITGLALLLASVCATNNAYAQLHKGNIFVGGSFTNLEYNSNTLYNSFRLDLKPQIGYFVANNLVLGLYSNLSLNKVDNIKLNTGGLGAFGRYYFNNINQPTISHLRFFGELRLGFLDKYEKLNAIEYHYPCFELGIMAGAAYFVSANVSLELGIGYQVAQSFDLDYSNHRMNFQVGVQVYLPSSRVKASYQQFKKEIKP